MRRALAIALALGATFAGTAWVPSTNAQQATCGPRDMVIGRLQQLYSEERTAVAVTAGGELMELLTSPSGTWTILVSVPAGTTCLVANGDGWKALNPSGEESLTESSSAQPQDRYGGV